MDIRGRRGKGSGRHGPNTDRPRSSRWRRCEYGMASRVSFQGLTTSSAQCGAAEAIDSDAATGWRGKSEGGVVLANQSGSVVSSQGSTTSSSSYSSSIAEQDHKSPWGLSFRPSSTHGNHFLQVSSSTTESRHRRAHLITDSDHRGNSHSACSPS
jgi:hypothetical protein